jgi:hypothetical protein
VCGRGQLGGAGPTPGAVLAVPLVVVITVITSRERRDDLDTGLCDRARAGLLGWAGVRRTPSARDQALICLAPVPPAISILRGFAASAIGTRRVNTPAS